MTKMENIRGGGDLLESLSRKLANPLAIIAGNAQFLLMTVKNSSSSVIRRLKAIDKEASNIIAMIDNYQIESNTEKEPNVGPGGEYS